jgi:hypothetical protein
MYTQHCTKKLLGRIKLAVAPSSPPANRARGSGYATLLF